ncbi:MAG: NUDIX hydrolase [Rhodocyclaceae bacterium]|nr:NUDIX hydrolase [Rhodocyclaceae bacterium]
MRDHHLIEEKIENREVFSGRLLKVQVDRVRLPDGAEVTREYILHPGAVVVIAVLDNGKLLFERQFRYPLGRVFLELPAGKIDPGEEILECAVRELREETGYEASEWSYLGLTHPCIGYSDERLEYFLARGLTHVGHDLDDEEFLEVLEMSVEDAYAAVLDGRITDGKTIAGLFLARNSLLGSP